MIFMDNFTPEVRSRIMSHIKGKDTKPEELVRKGLFALGFRFRKNDRRYPGHPDIVLPKYHTVIFVNGCFWHHHENCVYATEPKTNEEFWSGKFSRNRERDAENARKLNELGFRVIVVWECALKEKERLPSVLLALSDEIEKGRSPYVEFPPPL